MRGSINTKKKRSKEDKKERDRDFATLIKKPTEPKEEKIILNRPIYHNGRQYTVKIPKEIITYAGFKKGDMLKYELTISPNKNKPILEIKYVRKYGRAKT